MPGLIPPACFPSKQVASLKKLTRVLFFLINKILNKSEVFDFSKLKAQKFRKKSKSSENKKICRRNKLHSMKPNLMKTLGHTFLLCLVRVRQKFFYVLKASFFCVLLKHTIFCILFSSFWRLMRPIALHCILFWRM